jgi:hypothetical protein
LIEQQTSSCSNLGQATAGRKSLESFYLPTGKGQDQVVTVVRIVRAQVLERCVKIEWEHSVRFDKQMSMA